MFNIINIQTLPYMCVIKLSLFTTVHNKLRQPSETENAAAANNSRLN